MAPKNNRGRGQTRRSFAPRPDAPSYDPVIVDVTLDKPAHGGFCVGRSEGRVIFARLGAPGERVRVRVTEPKPSASFWRGDVIEVLEASPDRVPSVWPEAGVDGVGGADWAHVTLAAQRRYKSQILNEQLSRARVDLSRLAAEPEVVGLPGDTTGVEWRTRVQFAVVDGVAGMRPARSHAVVTAGSNPLAVPEINALAIESRLYPGVAGIDVAVSSTGQTLVVFTLESSAAGAVSGSGVDLALVPQPWRDAGVNVAVRRPRLKAAGSDLVPVLGNYTLRESVAAGSFGVREFQVTADGFWQVHPQAAGALVSTVMSFAQVSPGDVVWDLFSGAGLFTAYLADAVGDSGAVTAVEGASGAVGDARANLEGAAAVELVRADVMQFVSRWQRESEADAPDVIVLDPPRAGAGVALAREVGLAAGSRIVHVACDPASLARDVSLYQEAGWSVTGLAAFDLFPMTQHFETVVLLER